MVKLLAYSELRRGIRHAHYPRPDLSWSEHGGPAQRGNWAVAKLVEALFNTSHLSDVGCTYTPVTGGLAQRLLLS